MTTTRIIVIAKAPVPGFAKTRLIPALGETGAARLAARMLQHTLATALAAGIGPVELCAAPKGSYALSARLVKPDKPPPCRRVRMRSRLPVRILCG